jgi:hypothetical protein
MESMRTHRALSRDLHERHLSDALLVSERVLHFAERCLVQADVPDDELECFTYAQALRGRSYFSSCILLARNGEVAPMGALLRCLTEQFFVASAIRTDPTYVAKLRSSFQFQRRRMLKNAKKWPDKLTAATVSDAEIDELIAKLDSPQDTHTKAWAELGGNAELYEKNYGFLSKYVHPSLKSCDEHLLVDDGCVVGFTRLVCDDMLPSFILVACQAMLYLLESRGMKELEVQQELIGLRQACVKLWVTLPMIAE